MFLGLNVATFITVNVLYEKYRRTLTEQLGKNFSSMPSHVMNICAKFHSNPFTKWRDIASRGIDVNGQQTDRRTYDPKTQCSPPTVVGGGIKTGKFGENWKSRELWLQLTDIYRVWRSTAVGTRERTGQKRRTMRRADRCWHYPCKDTVHQATHVTTLCVLTGELCMLLKLRPTGLIYDLIYHTPVYTNV